MASALCSRRKSSGTAPLRSRLGTAPLWGWASEAVNKNKTTTVCLTLGLIFRRRTLFFRPLQQNLDPRGGVGVVVRLEMQLGNPPQVQTAGQLMPQVVTGMLQGGHGLVLLVLVSAQGDLDDGVARVRTHGHICNIHQGQAGIGKLKSYDLGKLIPDGYGHPAGTMLIHVKPVGLTIGLCRPPALPKAADHEKRWSAPPLFSHPFHSRSGRKPGGNVGQTIGLCRLPTLPKAADHEKRWSAPPLFSHPFDRRSGRKPGGNVGQTIGLCRLPTLPKAADHEKRWSAPPLFSHP